MAMAFPHDHQAAEEDFIDMDVSAATFICYTLAASSPPHSKDFEFHMSSKAAEREPITSPADELFYKGNLLPLHLPPRLLMVEKILQNSKHGEEDPGVGVVSTSRNAAEGKQRKSWSGKFKLFKQSPLCLKLKSLFMAVKASTVANAERDRPVEEESAQRRSFSGAISWNLISKSSSAASFSCSSSLSSSFSSSSSSQMLKRSSSANSEMESSILGAIAYCKESQQLVNRRKSADGVGILALPAACEVQEKPKLCRG